MEDTRRFTRLPVTINACLSFPNMTIDGEVHDLSLKGALMLCLSDSVPEHYIGHDGTINLELNDGDLVLSMSIRVAHVEDHYTGVEFLEMGIDTISHLRRLIELNLGSEQVLQRELGLLWDNRN